MCPGLGIALRVIDGYPQYAENNNPPILYVTIRISATPPTGEWIDFRIICKYLLGLFVLYSLPLLSPSLSTLVGYYLPFKLSVFQ